MLDWSAVDVTATGIKMTTALVLNPYRGTRCSLFPYAWTYRLAGRVLRAITCTEGSEYRVEYVDGTTAPVHSDTPIEIVRSAPEVMAAYRQNQETW